jgi:hypothetical protein
MSDDDATNWHKVMLATATTMLTLGTGLLTTAVALAKDGAFPIKMVAGAIVVILVGGFGLFLTRPSQTSATIEKLSSAIPGNPKPPLFPAEPPTPPAG